MKKNSGLLVISIFCILQIACYLFFRKFPKHLIVRKLKFIQKHDYLGFNPHLYSIEKYFNRKYFTKNDRDFTYHKLMSILGRQEDNLVAFNQNWEINRNFF